MRTEDNRDYGGIGLREDEALCVILDGATSGRDSGGLALRIATEIIDWYVDRETSPDPDTMIDRLRVLHAELFERSPQGSVSYLLVLVRKSGDGVALHAGDCLLGRLEEGHIVWLCQPHTLANALVERPIAEIAAARGRHRLTRSFRRREFMAPDLVEPVIGDHLILATDGFWADCSAIDQALYMQGQKLNDAETQDDRSCLQVWCVADGRDARVPESSENFYVRSRNPAD